MQKRQGTAQEAQAGTWWAQRRAPRPLEVVGVVLSCSLLVFLMTDPQLRATEGRWALRHFTDYPIYVGGGHAFFSGEMIYDMSFPTGDAQLPFTYPPFAALVFGPLSFLPTQLGAALLTLLSAVTMCWIIAIAWQACAGTSRGVAWSWVAVLSPLLLVAEPVFETLTFGQVNIILAACVIADTCASPGRQTAFRWLPPGVLVGLATAVKLTPAVFGLYFLLRRDWKALGWMAATFLAATGVAAAIRPELSFQYWGSTLGNPERIGGLEYASNQSWQGVLVRISDQQQSELWLILVVLTIGCVAVAMVHQLRRGNTVAAVALNSLIALLCSPVSWSHHWVWASVVLCALLLHRPPLPHASGLVGFLLAAAIFLRPHWLLPHDHGAELSWPIWAWPLGNSYVLLAALIASTAAVRPQIFAPEREQKALR